MSLRLILAACIFCAACTGTVTHGSGAGEADADPFAPDADPFAPDAAPTGSDAAPRPDAEPQPSCGDGVCNGEDTCSTCPGDCGSCAVSCGDAVCEGPGGETCTGCPDDCNTMDPVCGNGACDSGESATTCRADCGPADWPPAWAAFEDEVVALINEHRAAGTDCPMGATKQPMGAVAMSEPLRQATRRHSWDMSYSNYFSHTSCNGRTPWQRAAAAGTSATGETIGGGYPTPAAMVDGWMNSPGHCAILMNSGNTLIGVGYANEAGGKWTALFR